MADWNHVSASQVKTHRRCARKWWFEKIVGYRSPTTPAAELGRAIHAELETYLTTGEKPASPIARAGLSHLPSHEDNILVEAEFSLKDGLSKKAIGFIDLVEVDARRVTDHKTTSDFKWAKGEYELASDPQAILYSQYADASLFEGDGDIEFRHVYYRTRGTPASMTTSVVLSPDTLAEGFAGVAHTVNEMVEHAVAPSAKEVSYNAQACRDFGGCPFRGECAKLGVKTYGELSSLFAPKSEKKKETREGKGGKESMGFLDKIGKKSRGTKGNKRGRDQVVSMIKLLSPESNDEELASLDVAGLLKLEKHLSSKRAKKVFLEAYVNPPDGTPMDRRVEVALAQKAKVKKEGRDVQVTLEGHIRTDAKHAANPLGVLPDGRNIRKLKKKELVVAYWDCFNSLDDAQRAAWYSVSTIKEDVLLAAETGDAPSVSTAELRGDLRIVSDILLTASSSDAVSEEYQKVQKAIVERQVDHPGILAKVRPRKPAPPKVARPARVPKPKIIKRLPDSLGGTQLSKIRALDYPGVFRKVVFEAYPEDSLDGWVALSGQEGHVLADQQLLQWVYDGCPDKHKIKRTNIKNALCSFLTFVHNGQVVPAEGAGQHFEQGRDPEFVNSNEEVEALPVSESAAPSPATVESDEEDNTGIAGDSMSEATSTASASATLYVGCLPLNQQVTFLHDFLRSYQERVAEDAVVPHYGLIKYNEGPKRVAALLRQEMHEGTLALPAALVCDPSLPCSNVVLEVLKPHYPNVVARVG